MSPSITASTVYRNILHNRIYGESKPAREAHPENAALTKEEENAVVRWVEHRDSLGLGPKHRVFRQMVISVINNREGPRRDHMGDHFTARLLKRHPNVAASVMKATDRLRMVSCTTKGVIDHFKQLYDVIHRYNINPDDFWNFDQKGLQMGQGGKQNELIMRNSLDRLGGSKEAIGRGLH
jgi:hypothetical protein